MAQDKPNTPLEGAGPGIIGISGTTPLEGLVLGIVGVGEENSLSLNFACKLVENNELTERGVVGKNGISKIYVNSRNAGKVQNLIEKYMIPRVDINPKLKSELGKGFITNKSIAEVARDTDICFFLYDTMGGEQRRSFKSSKRNKSINSNVEELYKWRDLFAGYKGLMVFCTNPTDPMTYVATKIFNLDKDQAVGFNHVDTFRFWAELKSTVVSTSDNDIQKLKPEEKDELCQAIDTLSLWTAYVIGPHSNKCMGLYSHVRYDKLHQAWNNLPGLLKLNKKIIANVKKTAFELIEGFGSPNVNCIPALSEVIEAIVKNDKIVEMSYYIENVAGYIESIGQKTKDAIEKECGVGIEELVNQLKITGFCTGVPVEFYRVANKIIRARIAPDFSAGKHMFKYDTLATIPEYNEKQIFLDDVVADGVMTIAEAEVLKEHDEKNKGSGKYHWIIENALAVIKSANNNVLLLTERLKDNTSIPLLFEGETFPLKHTEEKKHSDSAKKSSIPSEVTCFATYKNRLVAITCNTTTDKRLLHAYEFQYLKLGNILKKETKKNNKPYTSAKMDITVQNWQRINFAALQDTTVYLTENKSIEKIELDWKHDEKTNRISVIPKTNKRISLKENILSFAEYKGHIFCGLSNGEVNEYDSDLNHIMTYHGAKKNKDIVKLKIIDWNNKRHVYVMNENNELYHSIDGDDLKFVLQAKKSCFDVAPEKFKDKEALCVYTIKQDEWCTIDRRLYHDEELVAMSILEEFKIKPIENSCGEDLEEIIAPAPLDKEGKHLGSHQLYLVATNRISHIYNLLSKEIKSSDVPVKGFTGERIKELGFVKYNFE